MCQKKVMYQNFEPGGLGSKCFATIFMHFVALQSRKICTVFGMPLWRFVETLELQAEIPIPTHSGMSGKKEKTKANPSLHFYVF